MLDVPIVGVAIIFCSVIASALAAGKSWIVRFDPVAFGILRPHMAFVLPENVLIVARTLQEKLIVHITTERTSQLGSTPIIITLRLRNGNSLTTFTGIDSRNGFFFIGMKRGHITLFRQKIVQGTFRASAPRQPGAFNGIFLHTSIGGCEVEIGDAFGPRTD